MTRKDFVLIARAVAEAQASNPSTPTIALERVARNLSSVCAQRDTSIGYQASRFLRACGVGS